MRDLLVTNLTHIAAGSLGATLMVALLALLERTTSRFTAHRLGWRAILFTAWIGVPVHELSHLGAAWLFGHRIISWSLFSPDPTSATLGYVRHAHAARSLRQLAGYFFIAIAPTVVGLSVLLLLLRWMTSSTDVIHLLTAKPVNGHDLFSAQTAGRIASDVAGLLTRVWHNRSPWLPLQLYLAICIACHLAPSSSDFKNAGRGLLATAALLTATASLLAAFDISF